MVEGEAALETNRKGWNHIAQHFHGSTALPEYGPLTPTEDTLRLLDELTDACVLELGCGSGHSLRYLADRGARELWGLDLSSTQIAFAEETLRSCASRVRLIESPMEVNPGIPQNYFDLVFSIYGLGWTTDLPGTMRLVNAYLRPGRKLHRQWRASRIRLPRMERRAIHSCPTLLQRRPDAARVVERRAHRHPASHARHFRGRACPCGIATRSFGRNPA
jgi:SAM-dependent methyltransferase